MTRPTHEPNPNDLIAGYILNDLSPEESDRLNQALAETPALQSEIASFGEAFSLLPYGMPIVEPAASLKSKILSAAAQSIREPNVISRDLTSRDLTSRVESIAPKIAPKMVSIDSTRRRNWQQWMPAISTGIAAVAIVALGLNQVQLSRQSQQTIALQQKLDATNQELNRLRSELEVNQGTIARLSQPETQTYTLTSAPANPKSPRPATARIIAKPGDVAVTLVAQDLPKLSDQQVYRLWAVAKPAAKPMYCGEFRQDDWGTAQWVAPNAACTQNPAQLLITLDAPTDPITSAGPLVMRSLS